MLGKLLQHSHMILLDFYIPLVKNSKDKIQHQGILKALHLETKKKLTKSIILTKNKLFCSNVKKKKNEFVLCY